MYYFTQEHLNNRFHHAVETSNLPELKYYLSSPELSSHADVNSLSTYNQPVWNYLCQAKENIQDYLLKFDYIKDKNIKKITINTAFPELCGYYDLYAAKAVLKQHKHMLTSDTLNNALMRAVELHGKDSIHLLLSNNFPEHIWKNGQAVFWSLIHNEFNAKTIMKYNINGTHDIKNLKLIQHHNSNVWLQNIITKLEPALNLDEPLVMNKLWSYIGESGHISLLHYFTHNNKYNIKLSIDAHNNSIFKMAILNSQYDLIEELMVNYGCRLNSDIENYIFEKERSLDDNMLLILQNMQKAIEFKNYLEADLPNNKKAQARPKI